MCGEVEERRHVSACTLRQWCGICIVPEVNKYVTGMGSEIICSPHFVTQSDNGACRTMTLKADIPLGILLPWLDPIPRARLPGCWVAHKVPRPIGCKDPCRNVAGQSRGKETGAMACCGGEVKVLCGVDVARLIRDKEAKYARHWAVRALDCCFLVCRRAN